MQKCIQPPALVWITVCMCSNRDLFLQNVLQKCGRDIKFSFLEFFCKKYTQSTGVFQRSFFLNV
jgi:hypothetical protein